MKMVVRTLVSSLCFLSAASAATSSGSARQIDWQTLLPVAERGNYNPSPPPAVHDYLGEGSMAALQTGSYTPNKELDGVRVKLPGFVVPLERGKDGLIDEFFLVPYFGACIHVPPPPPNQIVYVKMRSGAGLSSIEDAQWVTGILRVAVKTSALGAATYTLQGEKMEPYQFPSH